MVDYKIMPEGVTALTMDGAVIGDIYERDNAEMIVHNILSVPKLEKEIEILKKEAENYEEQIKDLRKEKKELEAAINIMRTTLQRVHVITKP